MFVIYTILSFPRSLYIGLSSPLSISFCLPPSLPLSHRPSFLPPFHCHSLSPSLSLIGPYLRTSFLADRKTHDRKLRKSRKLYQSSSSLENVSIDRLNESFDNAPVDDTFEKAKDVPVTKNCEYLPYWKTLLKTWLSRNLSRDKLSDKWHDTFDQ